MNRTVIEERIHAAIRPQLDECDRLLDYYTEGLPREVWEPIAAKFKPKTATQILAEGFKGLGAALEGIGKIASDVVEAINAIGQKKPIREDVVESA